VIARSARAGGRAPAAPIGQTAGVRRVGLTGGIGAGKSAVAAVLAERGATVIDADRIAREVVAAGTPGLVAVVEAFGPGVLRPDGELDRPALGSIVFADPAARRRLELITHPLIMAETDRRLAALPPDAVVVHDVPLLVEVGGGKGFDLIVVVETPVETRLSRLAERGLDRAEALARMATQAGDDARRAVADVVIDNSGDREHLRRQVDAAWGRIAGPADPAAAGPAAAGSDAADPAVADAMGADAVAAGPDAAGPGPAASTVPGA
jgi:dephospho-CoA kinase